MYGSVPLIVKALKGLAVPMPTLPLKYEVLLTAENDPEIFTEPVNS